MGLGGGVGGLRGRLFRLRLGGVGGGRRGSRLLGRLLLRRLPRLGITLLGGRLLNCLRLMGRRRGVLGVGVGLRIDRSSSALSARRLAATLRPLLRWAPRSLIVLTVWGGLSRRERCLDKPPQTAGELRIGVRGWCGCTSSWVHRWWFRSWWGLRPNVALGACHAPNVAFGAWDAPNAALGRFPSRRGAGGAREGREGNPHGIRFPQGGPHVRQKAVKGFFRESRSVKEPLTDRPR